MSSVNLYPWLKAVHVAAVLIFVGGLLTPSIIIQVFRNIQSQNEWRSFRKLDRVSTLPALLIAIASGATLASIGHWLPSPWLVIKLIFVVVVLAIHGVQTGQLRRLENSTPIKAHHFYYPLLGAVIFIAILATLKPLS